LYNKILGWYKFFETEDSLPSIARMAIEDELFSFIGPLVLQVFEVF